MNAELASRELNRSIVEAISIYQWANGLWSEEEQKGPVFSADNYLWLVVGCDMARDLSIVTLNYDLLLDEAFHYYGDTQRGVPQFESWSQLVGDFLLGKELGVPERGVYIKLHGTLDIDTCLNSRCSAFMKPVEARSRSAWRIRTVPKPCRVCTQPLVAWIVPPGRNKAYSEDRYHREMLTQAKSALDRAKYWNFLGYSFPTYDSDLMGLLESSLRGRAESSSGFPEVLVISPDSEPIAQRLSDNLQIDVYYFPGGFSEYVDSFTGRSSRREEVGTLPDFLRIRRESGACNQLGCSAPARE